MLIETREGFDYTGADCRGWMAEIGSARATSSRWSDPTQWSWPSSSRRRARRGSSAQRRMLSPNLEPRLGRASRGGARGSTHN